MIEKCPKCSKSVRMIAGLECPQCGHRLMTQNLDTDWKQYDSGLGRKRAKDADTQSRPDRTHNPKRRYPLDFEE
jgi:DNA-directed RNA polymerase subunit RPC12/RpoP